MCWSDGSYSLKSPDKLAIAVDLGTTTIAASLLDTESGKRLSSQSIINPQRAFGADVVSRLAAACSSPEKLDQMAALVNASLNRLARDLLMEANASPDALRRVAIAGNPAMEHLLFSLPVESLAFPPYRPLFTESRNLSTAELGWDLAVDARVFPLPGGFVGGDLVAFLYGVGVAAPRSPFSAPRLFLDLGTNGEIALATADRVWATSAAAGPAFEGGGLACGMAALPGAIHRVQFLDGRLALAVIGGGPPAGLCGTGVLDLVAELLRAGMVDATGRLLSAEEIASPLGDRVRDVAGGPAFILYRDAERVVYLSQEDIRQVQLAKGAIRAGMEVLCARSGLQLDDVQEVVLTGSFGAELAASSLKTIGIFTEKMVHKCGFVRNGALAGVERALLVPGGFQEVERLAKALTVIPLSGTPAFEKNFLKHIDFPETGE